MADSPFSCKTESGPNDRSGTERGAASVSGIVVLLWLFVYGYTGFLAGSAFGHPVIGILLALLVGVYPSGQIGIGAHYGGYLAYLSIPAIIVLQLGSIPAGTRLWFGICICLLLWLLLLPQGLSGARAAYQKRRIGKELGQASLDHLHFLLRTDDPGYNRESVVRACGGTREAIFIPLLAGLLERKDDVFDGPHASLRCEAARALAKIGTPEAQEILRRTLSAEENGPIRNGRLIEILRNSTPGSRNETP